MRTRLSLGVVALILALVPTVTAHAAAAGVNNVNLLDQNPYPGAGANTNIYYNAFTGEPCSVNDPDREDGWGIFRVLNINTESGKIKPEDTGVEMYGIYYGRIDDAVSCDEYGRFTIASRNIHVDIYMNLSGTFNKAGHTFQGSSGRTGLDQYNGITGGTLVLRGVVSMDDDGTEFVYTLRPNADYTNAEGRYDADIALTGGQWYTDPEVRLSMWNGVKSIAYTDMNWMMSGSDGMIQGVTHPEYGPVSLELLTWDMTTVYTTATVPEPLTMSLLALGGLAMLRRRR